MSVGSAQADWIKHEGQEATGRGASSVTRINFNQVKHSDLDGFVTACKTSCDENSDTCGGFILNYANTDKTRPAVCVFSKEDSTLAKSPTKDFYQVVSHDEVLALLEQLVPNLNTQEDAKWLTEALTVVTEAGYLTCEDGTGGRCQFTAIGPPTDAGSALFDSRVDTTAHESDNKGCKKSSASASTASSWGGPDDVCLSGWRAVGTVVVCNGEPWVEGKGNACWDQGYAEGAGKGNGWVVGRRKSKLGRETNAGTG